MDKSELVAAIEHTREVHPEIQAEADSIREVMDDYFVRPMLDMNYDLMADPIVGDLPVTWIDGSTPHDLLLRRKGRSKAYGKELPLFDAFLRDRRNVERLVMDVDKQHVYAIVEETSITLQGNTYVNQPKFTLIDSFGNEVNLVAKENLPFKHQVLAHAIDGQWQGELDGAQRMWDAEVRNTPSPEKLREEFERQGIDLPDDFRFEYRKFGDLDEWHVIADGKVLYKLRYLTNNTDGKLATDATYDDFRDRLMILEGGARDPIMIYEGSDAKHLWTPDANYFPHMVPWRELDFHKSKLDNNALEYARKFHEGNSDKVDSLAQAIEILGREQLRVKSKRYGHLEQARVYNFPDYNQNFFEVLQAYGNRASERQHVIKNFGQNFDLLHGMLNKLISPVNLRDKMPQKLQAIFKLRFAQGYRDFTFNQFAKSSGNNFMPDDNPAIIDPDADQYRGLTLNDWKALLDEGILEELSDGIYKVNINNLGELETPGLGDPAMRQAYANYAIAGDVVSRQYGIMPGDIWEQDLNKLSRGLREGTAFFLGKSWTAQIGQLANTTLYAGVGRTLRAFDPFSRIVKSGGVLKEGYKADYHYARSIGAVIIDATQWHASDTSIVAALLAPRTDFHFRGTGLKEWVKNRLSTPFMALEKFNRVVSAVAGRDMAKHNLKKLIENPLDKLARAELETMSPYPDQLNRKLGDILARIENGTVTTSQGKRKITVEDIDWVMDASQEIIRSERPELEQVRDYINSFAKGISDLTQHRLTPADRVRVISTNPILKVAFTLQSFMIKQTEFAKNLIAREINIINRAYINPDADLAGKTLGAARGIMARGGGLGLKLTAGVGFGYLALTIGHAVRLKGFDEDDLSIMAGLYQIALAGYLGEFMRARNYEKGVLQFGAGPVLGAVAAGFQDPLRAIGQTVQAPIGRPIGNYIPLLE